jgi:ComF family protein
MARVGRYHETLRALLTRLKFGGEERIAALLGELLARKLRAAPFFETLHVITPTPMHWFRRMQRPCDHANLLARVVSARTKLPMICAVNRVQYGPSQMKQPSKTARLEAVKNAFAPVERLRKLIDGRNVCIIDNLLVSGATVQEVAKSLRLLGAKKIYAAIVARAQGDGAARHEFESLVSDEMTSNTPSAP